MTCIMRVGSTSCVPGASVGSGRRAGWKPCISACGCWGCSGASTSFCAPSSSLWAVPLSIAARTSRSTMRPAGPDPSILERSRSFSCARRRTIGEALNCPFALPSAWASVTPSSSGASVSVVVWAWASPPSPPPSVCSASPDALPLRSGTSSPSPWIKAIASPTGTSWPSLAMSWARVPASSASSSIVTLSVSISAIGSPSETSSPSLLSHLRRVPSSIASPILGMITSGILFLLYVQRPTGRVSYLLLARESLELQVSRVRCGYLGAAHPFHWGVERVEGPLLDDRRDLARDPEPPPLLLHRDRAVRLLDGLDQRVLVERPDRTQVYNLGGDAVLLFEGVGGAQAQVHLASVGDQGNVRPFAGDPRLAELNGVVAVLYLTLRAVKGAGFEEDHGVRVPYRRDHHPLDVVGRHGAHDLEAREVPVEVLQGVRVLRRELDAAAVGSPDDQGHLDLAAGEVADLGGVLDDLVRGEKREVPGHHLDDGPHP